jgi:hypothetical protein
MADEEPFGSLFPPQAGEREHVIVAIHPGDLEELQLPHALEKRVQQRKGKLEGAAELPQRRPSLGVKVAEHQVLRHGDGDVQFLRFQRGFG